jgi:hypothetical protein
LLGLLCVSVWACNDNVAQLVYSTRVVNGDNGNPAAGTDATALVIGVQQADLPADEYPPFPIEDGQFDAVLELRSSAVLTRVRVTIEGPTTELLTAPPAFFPGASQGFIRMVTAPPSSCERVSFNLLEAPRAYFGMVQSGTFALVVGGTAPTNDQFEFFDALQWDSRLFSQELPGTNLGETRAASIDEVEILVLPTEPPPFIFSMGNEDARYTQVELHDGAGPRSALVSVPGVGAMVIGGEVAGEAQTGVSLVDPEGNVTFLELREPRSGPAATALGTDVLVVGGNAEGNAEILLEGASGGQPIAGVIDGVREAGLLVGDGKRRALWIGGTDTTAAVRQDTVRFDDCPVSCASSAGPPWTSARLGALQPAGSALVIGGVGSRLVDEVRWDGADVAIEQLLELDVARAGAGGIVLESGAFIVAGGDDGTGAQRQDFEFCVPAALEPL